MEAGSVYTLFALGLTTSSPDSLSLINDPTAHTSSPSKPTKRLAQPPLASGVVAMFPHRRIKVLPRPLNHIRSHSTHGAPLFPSPLILNPSSLSSENLAQRGPKRIAVFNPLASTNLIDRSSNRETLYDNLVRICHSYIFVTESSLIALLNVNLV